MNCCKQFIRYRFLVLNISWIWAGKIVLIKLYFCVPHILCIGYNARWFTWMCLFHYLIENLLPKFMGFNCNKIEKARRKVELKWMNEWKCKYRYKILMNDIQHTNLINRNGKFNLWMENFVFLLYICYLLHSKHFISF